MTKISAIKTFLQKFPVFICVTMILSCALFTFRLSQESIWNDEWFTAHNISQPGFIPVIKEIVYTENTPPVYFLLLKAWSAGGLLDSIVWLRLFSVLFAVLSVWGIYLLARAISASNASARIAAVLLALSPYVLWYAQEMRNATLAMFIAIFMMYHFRQYCHTSLKKHFYAALLFQLAGLFTHYYFTLFIPAQLLYLYIATPKTKRRNWWVAVIIMTVLFALWIPFLWDQVQMNRSSWLGKPTFYFPIRVLASFSTGYFFMVKEHLAIIPVTVCGVLFVIGLGNLVTDNKRIILSFNYRSEKFFTAVFFIIPVLLAFSLSFIKPIVFGGKRYLIIVLPLFFIAVAQGLMSFKNKKTRGLIISVIIICNIIFMTDIFRNYQKRRWDTTAGLVQKYAISGDCVFSTDYTEGKILDYYGLGVAELVHTKDLRLVKKTVRPYNRVWYIAVTPNLPEQMALASFMKEVFTKQIPTSIGDYVWITLYKTS